MTTPGISPAQLKRCRTLQATDIGVGAEYRWTLEVFDPRVANGTRAINTLIARTPQDFSRMKRSLVTKYRIPQENVRIVTREDEDGIETVEFTGGDKKEASKRRRGRPPKKGGNYGDTTDRGTSDVS